MPKIDNLDPKKVKVTCPNCHGSGEKTTHRGSHFSIYRTRKCYTCMGEGEVTIEEANAFKAAFEKALKEQEEKSKQK